VAKIRQKTFRVRGIATVFLLWNFRHQNEELHQVAEVAVRKVGEPGAVVRHLAETEACVLQKH
jgi:hypothetical protein